ncbi:hypothetical protein J4H86_16210 [Spiractinospora alimapuensis]|uniref:hypothetical protein n=1 Tax=Spiractinospora alimapuensis TaxID=2820884 RepID=UPI001F430915|nr:hypothetical protein [Spiractinospora alimapuensis]QVQ50458.1 hypothetical protein J4H86_16210 [Spiractinospora alimapuensis]
MSITALRRRRTAPPETRLEKFQGFARDRAEQFGPYARSAQRNASERILQAREWCAPRLEVAANRVEDTVAPRVASALSATARRVEPPNPRSSRRRVPRAVMVTGIIAAGAVVAFGVYRARRAAQEAEWQENLDRVREQVRETKDQASSHGDDTRDEQASDYNGRVRT